MPNQHSTLSDQEQYRQDNPDDVNSLYHGKRERLSWLNNNTGRVSIHEMNKRAKEISPEEREWNRQMDEKFKNYMK